MRSSDWSSDVCSSDLKPALSSISRLATDSADAAPALIHAVPGEAEMALPAKAACSAGDSIATCGAYRPAMASTAAWSANPPGHTSAARPDSPDSTTWGGYSHGEWTRGVTGKRGAVWGGTGGTGEI